ncbi:hypothetical protein DDB_G0280655 [Dictyostelium discoideum AX4]|uniref:Addiction module toxin, HicA family n=1 Tax=Dictyostelium discoideum TaxID=44689 RepID=Q54V25_DICDI|nr:hypothetical protein DDB_G0280655 [Dictyostelium discoideum AX4]EAL67129.1 hypothetical protein DDB_G0280655 [Dictyostelium discoideum AX4]|eukprot:XP_641106.1 hypothetical protein DDB_G0280655 [Dictyostelium discoideum AX4]
MKYSRVEKTLKENGWVMERMKGGHAQFRNDSGGSTTVPYNGNKDIPIGTLKAIEKQTGVSII